jgi:O-antigen/teichoic acid export membrane protein
MRLVAKGEEEISIDLLYVSSLILSILSSIIVGVFVGSADYFFKHWLGEFDQRLVNIAIISLIYMPFSIFLTPCWSYLIAKKDLKINGLVTMVAGGLNCLCLVLLFEISDLGIIGAIIVSSSLMISKNLIFLPIYLKKHGLRAMIFYKISLLSGLLMTATILITLTFFNGLAPGGLFTVIITYVLCLSSILLIVLVAYKTFKNVSLIKRGIHALHITQQL